MKKGKHRAEINKQRWQQRDTDQQQPVPTRRSDFITKDAFWFHLSPVRKRRTQYTHTCAPVLSPPRRPERSSWMEIFKAFVIFPSLLERNGKLHRVCEFIFISLVRKFDPGWRNARSCSRLICSHNMYKDWLWFAFCFSKAPFRSSSLPTPHGRMSSGDGLRLC